MRNSAYLEGANCTLLYLSGVVKHAVNNACEYPKVQHRIRHMQ